MIIKQISRTIKKFSSSKRNGAQKKTKVNFGRTIMQVLELLWFAKRHISRQSDIEQCKNQTHGLSYYQDTGIGKLESRRAGRQAGRQVDK